LTLSMAGGAAAQVSGQAELVGAQCESGQAFNHGSADFGTWQYDGVVGYTLASADSTHKIRVNVTKVPATGKKCAVTIAITQPLSNNLEEIPNSNFNLSPGDASEHPVPSTFQQGLGESDYQLTLNQVPSAASTGT